jgi:hypothetical protein
MPIASLAALFIRHRPMPNKLLVKEKPIKRRINLKPLAFTGYLAINTFLFNAKSLIENIEPY